MLSPECVRELQSAWLPNITDSGLDRLIELLEKGSPLLVHGCFSRALPTGCLATHAAWHHPLTANISAEAGVSWLHRVAGLNPAMSHVIREWDTAGPHGVGVRLEFLRLFKDERAARSESERPSSRLREYLEV